MPGAATTARRIQKGWVVQATSPAELAVKLGMEPAMLDETIMAYNRYCREGRDPQFERPRQHLFPLDSPPFYAVELWAGGPNTQGGPRRNHKAQILNTDGEPIPGLYGAGECGSIYGMLYPTTGGNLAECIAFGRVAAENAVKEKPGA